MATSPATPSGSGASSKSSSSGRRDGRGHSCGDVDARPHRSGAAFCEPLVEEPGEQEDGAHRQERERTRHRAERAQVVEEELPEREREEPEAGYAQQPRAAPQADDERDEGDRAPEGADGRVAALELGLPAGVGERRDEPEERQRGGVEDERAQRPDERLAPLDRRRQPHVEPVSRLEAPQGEEQRQEPAANADEGGNAVGRRRARFQELLRRGELGERVERAERDEDGRREPQPRLDDSAPCDGEGRGGDRPGEHEPGPVEQNERGDPAEAERGDPEARREQAAEPDGDGHGSVGRPGDEQAVALELLRQELERRVRGQHRAELPRRPARRRGPGPRAARGARRRRRTPP